jgi:hypothetical protein
MIHVLEACTTRSRIMMRKSNVSEMRRKEGLNALPLEQTYRRHYPPEETNPIWKSSHYRNQKIETLFKAQIID